MFTFIVICELTKSSWVMVSVVVLGADPKRPATGGVIRHAADSSPLPARPTEAGDDTYMTPVQDAR